MKILITGAKGFIGRNLSVRLEEAGFRDLILIDKSTSNTELETGLCDADFVFHLAGVNRPKNVNEYSEGNENFTQRITSILSKKSKKTPIAFSSSTQACRENSYGISKMLAEKHVEEYGKKTGSEYFIYRFPNVFGKWCRPNYNSFIATFCHNIANDMDITINDSSASVNLVYIDDVCNDLLDLLSGGRVSGHQTVLPEYQRTVGEVAELLYKFKNSRQNLITEDVGVGFTRALYSTWLSYLKPQQFCYQVPSYTDSRGVFCEMLKTKSAGQFSYFTAHPGITRGGHYHHSKNEKFLVIKGCAKFKFEHIVTLETYEITVSSEDFQIVETMPGWTHDVTNIGQDELLVMLWANEIFDREYPDTIARTLK